MLGVDPDHSHEAVMEQLYGTLGEPGDGQPTMGGFIRSFAKKIAGNSPRRPVSLPLRVLKWLLDKLIAIWHLIKPPPRPTIPDASAVMRCFPEEHAPVLSWLANQFAVLVNWYASVPGETWPNRNFAHAAQAGPLTARDEAAADVLAGLPLLPTVRTDCTRIEQPVEVRIADLPRARRLRTRSTTSRRACFGSAER